ncbi:ATPase [Streptomyces sp. NP160]|uniref:N-acetylglucosamine kinase n=1 Tax=Streptomyces sp. NP160 TaxID=2586637 RepID=UPI00111AFE63|nr:BadF/BadG/BcrA/BcrD ATPase family protein [Streptomyces sp. NP160]TNM60696.1 ATPase [Streptomyces sp. NP160]
MTDLASGLLLGVDVGGSKTAVAVADTGGRVLFSGRGPGGSPDELGEEGCLDVVQEALAAAGAPRSGYAVAALAVAGVDQPDEEVALAEVARERELVAGPGEGGVLSVVNDLFAVLRSAAGEPRGVAVIAGTGTNAVGLDGERTVRFLSLGPVSGDWGGGTDLGVAALGAACREEDGRGPATALTAAVREQYGTASAHEAVLALHRGQAPAGSERHLARAVLAAADAGDAVAVGLVRRLAEEVADFAAASASRLGHPLHELPVVLGGGLLHARAPRLTAEVRAALLARDPAVTDDRIRYTEVAPVVGSLLLAFDALVAAGSLPASARPTPAALADQL